MLFLEIGDDQIADAGVGRPLESLIDAADLITTRL
jgi:hypothetical protein